VGSVVLWWVLVDSGVLVLVGSGCFWLVLVGSGWFWWVLLGSGVFWCILVGSGTGMFW